MEEKEICINEIVSETTYPNKEVINSGVSLDEEINVLRQAVYELKLENEQLNKRLTDAGIK
jgi:SMC interacting uncharacterized protein involved in chromosome segregation